MRSRTSFFNPTVFRNDLKRFWPLTAAYTLIWLLLLPLSRLTEYANSRISDWNMLYSTLNITAVGGYLSAFCVGILFAMAAFSYLTNPRATNGLHALPERRETLFVTHWLAGLCSQLVPQAVCVLLTTAVLGAHGAFDLRVTGLMLLSLALPTLFFYSFGVFCMMFAGQILAAPVFYGVLNFLVVGVEMLVRTFAGNFLYGWAESEYPALMAFSPIVQLLETGVGADVQYRGGEPLPGTITVQGLGWLWLYAAVGLVFAALALLLYRARRSEATGNVVAVGWARPVFKYGVAFCTALALGQLVYYLFFGQYRSNGDYSLPGTLLCMTGAGLIGYFAAEMLLKKSFRVWKSGWKGAAVVTAVLVALGVGLSRDLTGYEGYVPDPDKVESVSVDCNCYTKQSWCCFTAGDPDTIRLAAAAHRAIIGDKERQQSVGRAYYEDYYYASSNDWYPETVGCYFRVTYRLKSGAVVERRYQGVTLYAGELNDPASPAAALTALYNDPTVSLMRALGRYAYNSGSDPRSLTDLRFTGGYYNASKWSGGTYLGEDEHDLTPAEAKRIYEAVLRDAAAGRLAGSLFADEEYLIGIQLYATYLDTRTYNDSTEPLRDEDGRTQTTFDVAATPRMTETLAALRSAGIEPTFR